MARPFSLQPLLDLMQTRTDEASRQLGALIAAENDAKSRLQMLEQYRDEYAERLRNAAAQGLTLTTLNNYQEFLKRIDEAIAQQALAVQQSAAGTAHGQQHWQAQNTRLKAIDTLSTRHQRQEQQAENRREQKLLDEFSARKFFLDPDSDKE
ncbi:MAG: flagellar export protein FliJ [Dechloromonas sp.]|nr:flagellar export protein FliJ [Dechloromonas sp.]